MNNGQDYIPTSSLFGSSAVVSVVSLFYRSAVLYYATFSKEISHRKIATVGINGSLLAL